MTKAEIRKENENKIERLRSSLLQGDLDDYEKTIVEQYCREYALYLDAMMDIDANGYTNTHDQVSASCTVRNQAIANMIKLEKILPVQDKEELPKPKMRAVKNF